MNIHSTRSRLRIGFLSSLDAANLQTWSGTHFRMMQSLANNCGEVIPLGPAPHQRSLGGKTVHRVSQIFLRKSFDYGHTLGRARSLAKFFEGQLRKNPCDIIFAPAASTEIAFLQTDIPVVYSSDATFRLLRDYYPFYSRMLAFSERATQEIESRALDLATAAVFPTEWAANSAVEDYGKAEPSVHVVAYGANIDPIEHQKFLTEKRDASKCRLLFLAVEWSRKGGDIAYETLMELRAKGINAELTVVGCVPPRQYRQSSVKTIPYLDKNDGTDRQKLQELLASTHFLLLPTRAEAFGVVFCEASAFSVPSIATNTGGVSGVVREGKNGHLLPLSARGKKYADLIEALWKNPMQYRKLARASRHEYEERLNWDCWGRSMRAIFADVL